MRKTRNKTNKERGKSKNIFLEIKGKNKDKDKKTKGFTLLYFIIAFIAIVAINSYFFKTDVKTVQYSEFKELITRGKISDLVINTETIQGTLTLEDGKKTKFLTSRVEDPDIVKDLQKNNIKFNKK